MMDTTSRYFNICNILLECVPTDYVSGYGKNIGMLLFENNAPDDIILTYLTDFVINYKHKDINGKNLLIYSIQFFRTMEIFQLILSNTSNVKHKDISEKTAIEYSILLNNEDVIKELIPLFKGYELSTEYLQKSIVKKQYYIFNSFVTSIEQISKINPFWIFNQIILHKKIGKYYLQNKYYRIPLMNWMNGEIFYNNYEYIIKYAKITSLFVKNMISAVIRSVSWGRFSEKMYDMLMSFSPYIKEIDTEIYKTHHIYLLRNIDIKYYVFIEKFFEAVKVSIDHKIINLCEMINHCKYKKYVKMLCRIFCDNEIILGTIIPKYKNIVKIHYIGERMDDLVERIRFLNSKHIGQLVKYFK